MEGNSTEKAAGAVAKGPRSGTLVIAIIIPSVLIILLFVLIIVNRHRGFLFPRLVRHELRARENQLKTRQEELESHIKSQHFCEWLAGQKEGKSGAHQMSDPLCAICLDDFTDDAQVRGLQCCHAFHSHCLDEWFTKYNEYCPLCHGPIIPGRRPAKSKARELAEPSIPVVLMV
jgi:E3 ubiquitin-protein ligase RHA2